MRPITKNKMMTKTPTGGTALSMLLDCWLTHCYYWYYSCCCCCYFAIYFVVATLLLLSLLLLLRNAVAGWLCVTVNCCCCCRYFNRIAAVACCCCCLEPKMKKKCRYSKRCAYKIGEIALNSLEVLNSNSKFQNARWLVFNFTCTQNILKKCYAYIYVWCARTSGRTRREASSE